MKPGDSAICKNCGNPCIITVMDSRFDYAGTHCTAGRTGVGHFPDHGSLVSDCCEVEVLPQPLHLAKWEEIKMCEKIYYYRDHRGALRSTICIIAENGWLARGVAICNDKDNFNKKIGRAIAKGRASKALKTMKSGDEINLKRDHELAILMKLPAGIEKVKSCYDPFLTDYEKTLLGNERRAA